VGAAIEAQLKASGTIGTGTGIGPAIGLSSGGLTFTAFAGGPDPAAQSLVLTNVGAAGSVLNYSVTADASGRVVIGGTTVGGALDAGASTILTVTVHTSGLPAGTLLDTLTITAPGAVNNPVIVPLQVAITGPSQGTADVAASVAANPAAVAVGQVVALTFTAANAGPGIATQVVLSVSLPSGLTILDATASAGGAVVSGQNPVTGGGNVSTGAVALGSGDNLVLTVHAVAGNVTGGTNPFTVPISAFEVNYDSTTLDPNPGNNFTSLLLTINP
jgi:uncharacterized repeat protein (TIGR01451 family)